jgi:hypothetical protein
MKILLYILFPFAVILCLSFSALAQQNDNLTIPYYVIDSNPQNADVYINNDYAGKTPFRILLNDSADVPVRLKLKGYLDFSFSISSNENTKYKLVNLLSTGIKKVSANLVSEDNGHYFNKRKKIIPITLSALFTAGAGISAYYFKSLAIDNLDSYNNSGDASALDRKRKYDIISGVSLGLFQAGFSALLYFLLIDN